ncbi:MAG TPA: polysaccharide deacetylase family protein [Flavisolibacter sp.]|nr:polysaccharide deacetylase family protein [Flavisolibacter sp.]
MHRYFIKTPWIAKRFFSSYVWDLPADGNAVYLTFDDGPHPVITPWVLDTLKQYGAEATFFCIGNNVQRFPAVYKRILDEGHAVGNHSFHHLNGWKTSGQAYMDDISKAAEVIDSNLFRPPYGRIRQAQARKVAAAMGHADAKIIMWDVLSADFDRAFTAEECFSNVVDHTVAGSIIVFHDSEKAFGKLREVLPGVLKELTGAGFHFKKIKI